MYEKIAGEYTVEITSYNDEEKGYKNCLQEVWKKDGTIFNPKGAAIRIFRPDERYNLFEEWRNEKGEVHREDKPARIFRFPSTFNADAFGMTQEWMKNGKAIKEAESIKIQPDEGGFIYAERCSHNEIACVIEGKINDIQRCVNFFGEYRVSIEPYEDEETTYQNAFIERWKKEDIVFNPIGPAIKIFRADERYNLSEEWHNRYGQIHRENAPARISRFPTSLNAPSFEVKNEWFLNGLLTRDNGPAVLVLDNNGVMVEEKWVKNGLEHRIGGPAYLSRDYTTFIDILEHWSENGKLHREHGPAYIERHEEKGIPYYQDWCRKGVSYREGNLPTTEHVSIPTS